MPRVLQPCGTPAAYRRHRRRGEAVDDACARAARNQKNERVSSKRDATAAVVQLAIAAAPPVSEDIDPLAEARESLRMVKAAMEAGAPGTAALSKQHMELVSQIARLEAASKPRESKLDELARRRADRIANSQA